MTMDIDWSKAPEGATHYAPAGKGLNERWFDMTTGEFGSVWHEDQWHVITFSAGRKDLIAKPCAEWNGEGLPARGTKCECRPWKDHDAPWTEVEFIASWLAPNGQTYSWVHTGYGWLQPQMFRFRPIRTPEQIAAEEREKRLVLMSHAYQDMTGRSVPQFVHEAFRALDDAGYRKVQP